ncbi:MAG: hypothetical protein Q7T49_02880 [bacterium]|nr:hypothetical protein [bacterium]
MPDIIKTKRSLKEILPNNSPSMNNYRNHLPPNDAPPPRPHNIDWNPRRRFSPRLLVGIVLIVLIVFGGILVSSTFAKVTVKITPVQGRLLLNHTFDAFSNPTEGELGFSVVTSIPDIEKKLVPASGSEQVSRKASGTIIVYNNYDDKIQKLVKNTRFQTKDGKIYRVSEAISVPGTTTKDGQTVPGSIEVQVTADQPGAEYNIDLSDFTIPGFKGDPRFDKFYARSKTVMTGGLVGEVKKVSTTDREKALTDLENILRDRMIKEAKLQIPPGFVLFDDAYFLTFEEQTPVATTGSNDQAEIALKATFNGILFDRKALSYKVAKEQVPDFDGRELEIKNLSEIKFKLLNREEIKGPQADKISFTLDGNAHLAWTFDQGALISRLQSASKGNYESIFAQFPTIKEASIVFFPPWVKSIPNNIDKIKVEVTYDK